MADYKRQHYVPKVYLKGFKSDENGKQTNLILVKTNRVIPNAQLGNQCAKDYFYSKDAETEKILSKVEGAAGKVFRKLKGNHKLEVPDLEILRLFVLLQFVRTDGARTRFEQGIGEMLNPGGLGGVDMNEIDTGESTISNVPHMVDSAKDLGIKIFENKTKLPFITSDDPATLTHKFLVQKFNKSAGYGLGSSGVILSMPITPKHLFLLYDPHVYYFGGIDNVFCKLKDISEVKRFNDLQTLNAVNCLYFNDWGVRKTLLSNFEQYKKFRVKNRVVVSHAVYDRTDPGDNSDVFRVVTPEELERIVKSSKGTVRTMAHVSNKPIILPNWPKLFKVKLKPKYHDTGTEGGIIRPTRMGILDF